MGCGQRDAFEPPLDPGALLAQSMIGMIGIRPGEAATQVNPSRSVHATHPGTRRQANQLPVDFIDEYDRSEPCRKRVPMPQAACRSSSSTTQAAEADERDLDRRCRLRQYNARRLLPQSGLGPAVLWGQKYTGIGRPLDRIQGLASSIGAISIQSLDADPGIDPSKSFKKAEPTGGHGAAAGGSSTTGGDGSAPDRPGLPRSSHDCRAGLYGASVRPDRQPRWRHQPPAPPAAAPPAAAHDWRPLQLLRERRAAGDSAQHQRRSKCAPFCHATSGNIGAAFGIKAISTRSNPHNMAQPLHSCATASLEWR